MKPSLQTNVSRTVALLQLMQLSRYRSSVRVESPCTRPRLPLEDLRARGEFVCVRSHCGKYLVCTGVHRRLGYQGRDGLIDWVIGYKRWSDSRFQIDDAAVVRVPLRPSIDIASDLKRLSYMDLPNQMDRMGSPVVYSNLHGR